MVAGKRISQGSYGDLNSYLDFRIDEKDKNENEEEAAKEEKELLENVTEILVHSYGTYYRPIDIFVIK